MEQVAGVFLNKLVETRDGIYRFWWNGKTLVKGKAR